jgi:superfamily II DNA/RNA helicase
MSNNFRPRDFSTYHKALTELKIVAPTEIQLKAIPLLLENKTDLVGLAKNRN